MWIRSRLEESRTVLDRFLESADLLKSVTVGAQHLVESLRAGNKVLSCGNGGSMCDAMHFAEELSGRFRSDRPALSGLCLSDPGAMTCIANDYGYENVFARSVEALGRNGDVLLAISTSGNSPNILRAADTAHQRQMKVIALLGKDGGKLRDQADVAIVVPSDVTERIQEIHIKIIHIFIEFVERSFFPALYANPD